MTLLYCSAIWHSAQLSHLPSALVSRCAFSQVTFCCQLQHFWHFKMSLLRTLWSTSGFHKKCCWSPLRDLPLWQPKGLFTLPFLGSTLENSEALQSFLAILCQIHNSLPVSLLSEELRWVHSVGLLFCSSLDLHVQYSSIHLYSASMIPENQCWSHSMRL